MITLKIGITTRAGVDSLKDEEIKNSIVESRWRLGIGVIDGRKLDIQRRMSLGEFEFRFNGTIISPPEMWNATEYMDWRDSTT